MIRLTAEASSTFARFTLHEVAEDGKTLYLIEQGLTLRILERVGLSEFRKKLEALRFNESANLDVSPSQIRKALRAQGWIDGVDVTHYYPSEVAHGSDASAGIGHAKLGFPVAVRITRGNNSQVLHLSPKEATQLSQQLAALVPHLK